MRKVFVGLTVAVLCLVGSDAAWAHITVSPSSAAKGSFAKLTFRVPNERDDAATTKVEVFFPEDAPLAFVSVKPVPGWSFSVAKRTLATPIEAEGAQVREVVNSVTWTGGEIRSGEFQEFDVSAGPLPDDDADTLVFKALQTYADGDVVRWIDPTPASGEEPEHPAPELTLTAAGDDNHGSAGESADKDDDGSDALPIGLSLAALVVALAAGGAARRARRPAATG